MFGQNPPSVNESNAATCRIARLGFSVSGDWKAVDAATVRDRVVKKVRPGSIIVLHDGGGDRAATIAAVPLIIDGLKSMGYEFATVSELLEK
ncbi:polysaccharide deacetylase family protein [Pontiella sulfatireligans]|uniref:hypothetical protein n=1 Tax=Pontiella sulfatireligans TaxID=2750658 RepID=UPI00109BFF7C|nr:hypothetical protein [Pontiella sulfatireligans]